MRTLVLSTLAAAGALTFATPVLAQDTVDAYERAPFSGVYVGGSFGFDAQPNDVGEGLEFDRNLDGRFGDTVTTATGANAFSPGFCNGQARSTTPGQGCFNDRDEKSYYGRVGFDIQRGAYVGGIVGEFGKSEIRDSVAGFSTTPASYSLSREIDWEASVRARGGFAANTTLFYGTAGVGYARISNYFTSTNLANAYTNVDRKNNQWGFVGGGGIEQKLGRNVSVGVEYLFHRYKDQDYKVRVTQGTAPATNPFVLAPNTTGTDIRRSFDFFRWHSVRGVVNFRF